MKFTALNLEDGTFPPCRRVALLHKLLHLMQSQIALLTSFLILPNACQELSVFRMSNGQRYWQGISLPFELKAFLQGIFYVGEIAPTSSRIMCVIIQGTSQFITNGAVLDRGRSSSAAMEEINALFIQVSSPLKMFSCPLGCSCRILLLQRQVFFVFTPLRRQIRLIVKVRCIGCRIAFLQRLYTGKVFVCDSPGFLKLRAVSQRNDNGLHQGDLGCR